MKHILITIAAILLVGGGESQQSVPPAQTQPAEPVSEAPAQPSPQAEEATSTTDNWDGKQKWEIKTSSGKIPEAGSHMLMIATTNKIRSSFAVALLATGMAIKSGR